MPRLYYLSSHVNLCTAAESIILLDLNADKYLGLGPRESRALRGVVAGWPDLPDDSMLAPLEAGGRVEDVVEEMCRRGILTPDERRGKLAIPTTLPRPTRQIAANEGAGITIQSIRRLIGAVIITALRIRVCSFRKIAASLERRKSAHSLAMMATDLSRIAAVTSVFYLLRPFLFTTMDQCVFDSLVLLEFLASHGLYATWVIGVQPAPFLGHSWVQFMDVVLNDTPERVRKFTPILAV